jgi:hypothetical protein
MAKPKSWFGGEASMYSHLPWMSPKLGLLHISDEDIVVLDVPNAIPLGYRLNDHLQVIDRYLIEMPH